MKKRLLIGGIIIVVIAIGGTSYIVNNKIKKENALKVVQLNIQKANEKKAYDKRIADAKALADAKAKADEDANAKADAKAIADAKIVGEKRLYIKMHEMINSKIVSTDGLRYGVQPITSTVCDQIIKIINNNNYVDKNTLLLYLYSWKKNDFSNAVKQHNYIWDKLGGEQGKAITLR